MVNHTTSYLREGKGAFTHVEDEIDRMFQRNLILNMCFQSKQLSILTLLGTAMLRTSSQPTLA